MFCPKCGEKVDDSVKVCPKCGQTLGQQIGSQTPSASGYFVAGLGARLGNELLDYIGYFLICIVFGVVVGIILALSGNQSLIQGFSKGGYSFISSFLILIFYFVFFESIWQRTPGKWLTKTKVVMKDGSKPDFKHILGRTFARLIPFEPFSFFFSHVGWHDSLSGTLVVPASLTASEIQQIDPKNPGQKTSGGVKVLIIIAAIFLFVAAAGIIASTILTALHTIKSGGSTTQDTSFTTTSRDATRVADVNELSTALELYNIDYKTYPASMDKLIPDYLQAIPTAPTPADGSCTADQNNYQYVATPDKGGIISTYSINFCLGGGFSNYSAGTHTTGPNGIDGKGFSSNSN